MVVLRLTNGTLSSLGRGVRPRRIQRPPFEVVSDSPVRAALLAKHSGHVERSSGRTALPHRHVQRSCLPLSSMRFRLELQCRMGQERVVRRWHDIPCSSPSPCFRGQAHDRRAPFHPTHPSITAGRSSSVPGLQISVLAFSPMPDIARMAIPIRVPSLCSRQLTFPCISGLARPAAARSAPHGDRSPGRCNERREGERSPRRRSGSGCSRGNHARRE
jgi:hypothetical protein